MDLFKLTGTIAVNNDEANQNIDETTNKAEKSESKMGIAFKKIGAAVATAFAVSKIVEFGKSVVEATASVAAEQSAFEQIMGNYTSIATDKVKEIADATGMVASRLTPYMTSMTAKFKGLGYDIDTATDLASGGLNLAADAAAFWDKSLDDSMSSLNSFVNGSYEGGEAIGLFANETQMAQYAIQQGIADSTAGWQNLDEATKQATRLEYAQAMFALSGATGQAAKESDQYANVMGNLVENWRQFKAAIGAPLLQALVPIMKSISSVIGDMVGGLKQGKSAFEVLGEGINKLIPIVSDVLVKVVTAIVGALPGIISTLGTLISSVLLIISSALPQIITSVISIIPAIIDALMNAIPLILNAAVQLLMGIINAIPQIIVLLNTVLPQIINTITTMWSNNIGVILNAAIQLLLAIVQAIPVIINALIPILPTLITAIVNTLTQNLPVILNAAIQLLMAIVQALPVIIEALVGALPTVVSAIVNALITNMPTLIVGAIQLFMGILQALPVIIQALINAGPQIIQGIIIGLKNSFGPLMQTVQMQWEQIKQTIWEKVTGIWNIVRQGFDNIKNSIWEKINGAKNNISSVFENIKTIISNVINSIKNNVSNVFNSIKSVISNPLNAARSTVSNIFNGIQSAISSAMNTAQNAVSNAINVIRSKFNFSWSLPNLKVPKVVTTGKFSLNPPSVPWFGLEWHAKAMDDGMIMNQPTVFGVNPKTGSLLAGGEVGSETVVGTESLMSMINNAVKNQNSGLVYYLQQLIGMMAEYMPELINNLDRPVVLSTGETVGALTPYIDSRLGEINKGRGRGR